MFESSRNEKFGIHGNNTEAIGNDMSDFGRDSSGTDAVNGLDTDGIGSGNECASGADSGIGDGCGSSNGADGGMSM